MSSISHTSKSNLLSSISTNQSHVVSVYTFNSKGEKVFQSLNKNQKRLKIDKDSIEHLIDRISTIQNRRECYTFQVLKQFFLFPEDTSQSLISVSPYDKIIFDDQAIHTMVRMYETKERQSIIWGFLNLKFWKIYKRVIKFTQKVVSFTGKIQKKNIKEGFKHMKIYSMMFSPKKSQENSGLTRVVSNSVISSRKPGQIYQSQVKRIRINANQIYKSRDLDNQKREDRYKSASREPHQQHNFYQNHYVQSSNYIPNQFTSQCSQNHHNFNTQPLGCSQQCSYNCTLHYTASHQCSHYNYNCMPCSPSMIHYHIMVPPPPIYPSHYESHYCNDYGYYDRNQKMQSEMTPKIRRPYSSRVYHIDERIDYMNDLQKDLYEGRQNKHMKTSSFIRQFKR